ncbi:type II toxin-antitoxin system HipA family toxin [Candidatus Viadribacter manganicus]|uniref:Kinase n=1 Tax=Candidatus Viadribacter manganicus TaxID=1759059 RepID=A0A1B1AGT8_9PROT|nr:HipA domain-containing protein [Candidatus Viadribacter manganicus]ANP45765.1 kinase [Candidatus Viadribacter manganicus]
MAPTLNILEVLLGDRVIGALTRQGGDQVFFALNQDYIDDDARPTLSLSFKSAAGGLITQPRQTQTRLPPFFSNLLPEGALRDYLAKRAGVNPEREFFLMWVLGQDLPGALTVRPAEGQTLPPGLEGESEPRGSNAVLRFSLAGMQLKFSALERAQGGLTIPARGVGGEWIVKLPSLSHAHVAENELSMMSLARAVGIEIPEFRMASLDEVEGLPDGLAAAQPNAFAIQRFDRTHEDGGKVHIEDFAQVFGLYPARKYDALSYANIAKVIWTEAGEDDAREFVRRLVFNALIGNGDMHAKNWSLIYRDGRSPRLSPAYDFLSTLSYIEGDGLGLKLGRVKAFSKLTWDEFDYLAAKAGLPQRLVSTTGFETVERFREVWAKEAQHLPLPGAIRAPIEAHLAGLPIARAS